MGSAPYGTRPSVPVSTSTDSSYDGSVQPHMIAAEEQFVPPRLRLTHEALFSMNLAMATMAATLLYADRSVISVLEGLEISAHHLLHMRQTDFIEGHFEFFLPGMLLLVCIWILLELVPRSLNELILKNVAGIAALSVVPIWWLGLTYAAEHRYGWNPFYAPQIYETILVVVWAVIFLAGEPKQSVRFAAGILLAHGCFWIWQFGPYHPTIFLYDWQIGPFMGFGSSFTWLLYLADLRKRTRSDRSSQNHSAKCET